MCKNVVEYCYKLGKEAVFMPYEGYTEKRKASNKRYMDKLTRITLWLKPEEKKIIEDQAAAAGKKTSEYIKDILLPLRVKNQEKEK